MYVRNFIFAILLCIIPSLVKAQSYVYSYTDPCTGMLKTINVPTNGVTVTYFGQMNTFSPVDFTNGTFNNWADNVYSSFGGNNPCGSTIGVSSSISMAQNSAMNVLGILNSLDAISSMAGGSSFNTNGVTESSKTNSKSSDKKNNKKNNSNSGSSESTTSNTGSNGTNTSGSSVGSNGSTTTGSNGSTQTSSGSNQTNGSNGSTQTTGSNGSTTTGSNGSTQTSSGSNQTAGSNGSTTGSNGSSTTNGPSNGSTQTAGSNGSTTTGSNGTNNTSSTTNGGSNTESTGSNTGSTTGSGSTGSGSTGSGSTGGSGGSGSTPPNNNSTGTDAATNEEKKSSNVLGGSIGSIQNATSTSTTSSKGGPGKDGGKPSIVLSSDFAGFNFKQGDVSYGGKGTAGWTSLNWDGSRSHGFMLDYTTANKGPNFTAFYALIKKRRIDLISATGTTSFYGKGSLYGTIAIGQMWNFPKVKNLKAIYMATSSMGNVFGTKFIGTAFIAGGMYDMKLGKRTQIKFTNLFIYAPYISYYNDMVLKSPYVIMPIIGTNIGVTKKFKLNVNLGGTYAIGENVLNFTFMMGTRLAL